MPGNRTIVRCREVIQSESVLAILMNELAGSGRERDDSDRVVGDLVLDELVLSHRLAVIDVEFTLLGDVKPLVTGPI